MILLDNVGAVLSSGRLKTTVLDSVSITLPTNDHVVILGREGSGKTTLIRLLSGAVLPTTGTIDRYARVSFPVGFMGGFKQKLSVRENIAHTAYLYDADADEVVDFVAEVADFREFLRETYRDLPPQLRLKMAYALSYAIPFELYLIDSRPIAGENEFRAKCEYLFEQRMKESGFILATSQSRHARKYARRVGILHNRQIVLYDDVDRGIWEFERLNTDANADGGKGSDDAVA